MSTAIRKDDFSFKEFASGKGNKILTCKLIRIMILSCCILTTGLSLIGIVNHFCFLWVDSVFSLPLVSVMAF